MNAYTKSQGDDKKSHYVPPANFIALQNFLDTASRKHTEEFGKFYIDDPTTVGFSLWFNPSSPLFNTNSELGESAFNYLIYSGETVRAEKLFKFITLFQELTQKHPHFFLTLSGLGNIYEFTPGESVHEKELTITTNESMDFRIASLVELYVQATYDIEYRRRVVPINLTEFKMKVVISEIRSFKSFLGLAAGGVDANGFRELNDSLGFYKIDMERCRFDFSESNPFLETINNSQPEIAENVFKIISGNTHFHHNKVDVFDVIDVAAATNIPTAPNTKDIVKQSRLKKLGDDIKNKAISTITDGMDVIKDEFDRKKEQVLTDYNPVNLAGQLINRYFTSVIDSKFKQAVLGNVFFTDQIPSGASVVDDLVNGRSPNIGGVLEGRTGDAKSMMRDAILGYDSIPNQGQNSIDVEAERERILGLDDLDKGQQINKRDALFRALTEIFDNADKLEPQQIETILEHFTKANLGNVFTGGNNID